MTLGEGIFWSTVLILVAFFLYQVSVKRKWKTVGKVFAILVLVGALIGGGFWGWNVYESRPRIMGELGGVRLGMSPVEVKLLKGVATQGDEVVELEKMTTFTPKQLRIIEEVRARMARDKQGERDDDKKFKMTWVYKQSEYSDEHLIIRFTGDEQNALRTSTICESGGYNRIFGLNTYYLYEESVIKKLGTPSHESISSDGLKKMISYEQWKVAFEIEKNHVISWCVTESGKMTYTNEYGEE